MGVEVVKNWEEYKEEKLYSKYTDEKLCSMKEQNGGPEK